MTSKFSAFSSVVFRASQSKDLFQMSWLLDFLYFLHRIKSLTPSNFPKQSVRVFSDKYSDSKLGILPSDIELPNEFKSFSFNLQCCNTNSFKQVNPGWLCSPTSSAMQSARIFPVTPNAFKLGQFLLSDSFR